MHRKLTLSLDREVIDGAKRYARDSGTSVSALVEAYLRALGEAPAAGAETAPTSSPAAQRLIGIARQSRAPDPSDAKLAYLLDQLTGG